MSGDPRKRRLSRRQALGVLGGAGAVFTAAGGGASPNEPVGHDGQRHHHHHHHHDHDSAGRRHRHLRGVAERDHRPYPSLADFLRSDIRENKSGLPLALTLTVVNTANVRASIAGHVEVTINGRSAKVTQIAFPEDVTAQVNRTGVYASSGQNPTTNARDNVFSDGVSHELITLTGGDATSGFTAAFQVGLAL